MKKRVNISIDEKLLEWARDYSKRRYTNFSRLVAEYIVKLMEKELKK
jgi:post-segregation antitoxin (ccd killing protein)